MQSVPRSKHSVLAITRQAMCVERNSQVRSCNHCCSARARNITYSEFVSTALNMQHAMPVRLHSIFPHYLIHGTIFEKHVTECKICVLILSKNFV